MHKIRADILARLLENRDDYLSGNEMAQILGISRVAVWKHIKQLQQEGYSIEGTSGRGYRLTHSENILLPELAGAKKTKNSWPSRLFYRQETDSTNQWALRELAGSDIAAGTVFLAGSQGQGQGRHGRKWHSPPGGLYCSIVLKPDLALQQVAILSLVSALAVAHALEAILPPGVEIKWPNDILHRGEKIGGILLQTRGEFDAIEYVIIGIGINVNTDREELPEEIRSHTASLYTIAGVKFPLTEVFQELMASLQRYYLQYIREGFAGLRSEFKGRCSHLGKDIQVKMGKSLYEGLCADIDDQGNLILKQGKDIKIISSGEIISQ